MHVLRALTVIKTETKVNIETKNRKPDTEKREIEIIFNTKPLVCTRINENESVRRQRNASRTGENLDNR